MQVAISPLNISLLDMSACVCYRPSIHQVLYYESVPNIGAAHLMDYFRFLRRRIRKHSTCSFASDGKGEYICHIATLLNAILARDAGPRVSSGPSLRDSFVRLAPRGQARPVVRAGRRRRENVLQVACTFKAAEPLGPSTNIVPR